MHLPWGASPPAPRWVSVCLCCIDRDGGAVSIALVDSQDAGLRQREAQCRTQVALRVPWTRGEDTSAVLRHSVTPSLRASPLRRSRA